MRGLLRNGLTLMEYDLTCRREKICYIISLRLTILVFQSQLWLSFGDSSGRPSCYAWTGGRGYMLVDEAWVVIV
jgi:hypothetical protein